MTWSKVTELVSTPGPDGLQSSGAATIPLPSQLRIRSALTSKQEVYRTNYQNPNIWSLLPKKVPRCSIKS